VHKIMPRSRTAIWKVLQFPSTSRGQLLHSSLVAAGLMARALARSPKPDRPHHMDWENRPDGLREYWYEWRATMASDDLHN